MELMEGGFTRIIRLVVLQPLRKNCTVAPEGQHKGKEKEKTLVTEAICDTFLYIWFFNLGAPGSLNDPNILDRSSIGGALIIGTFEKMVPPCTINGRRQD